MIIAIDPGKMTGWARLNKNLVFNSGEQPLYDVIHFVYEIMKQGVKPEIICEDFIFTKETLKKTRQIYSTEGLGALRFLCEEYECQFYIQTPAAAKRFSSNDKLKQIGWYRPGKTHANDAARHLLLHGVENGLVNVRQFM